MTVEYRPGNADEPQVPRWVGVMIAVVLVGSMMGGGGLWAWSYYSKPNDKDLQEVRVSSAMISQAPARPVTNTIIPIGTGATKSYQIRATDIVVSATKGANDPDFTFRFLYTKSDFLPPDQLAALTARARLVQDATYAKFLKVTDDQIAQLKALPAEVATAQLVVSPADMAKMKTLFAAYLANSKSDNEQAVVKAAQQVGQSSLGATRAAIAPRAEKIKQILTPEQLAQFKAQ